MFDQYLNQIQSIFDRRFVLAYWFPALLFSIAGCTLAVLLTGLEDFLALWGQMTTWQQSIIFFSAVVAVTFIALVLEAFSAPIMRLYRGYALPDPMVNWLLERQNWIREKKREKYSNLENKPPKTVYQYNSDDLSNLPYPTDLGKIFGLETDYSYDKYGIDGNIWWERLILVLPEYFRQRLDATITPVFMMINLSLLSLVFAFLGSFFVALLSRRPILFLSVYLIGLFLFIAFYRSGVTAAFGYGETVKSAYDLYRMKLFEEMKIPLPKDQVEEKRFWYVLNNWVKLKLPPEDSLQIIEEELEGDLAQKSVKRFHYSAYTKPKDQQAERIEVRLLGKSLFVIEKKSDSSPSREN